MSHSCRAIPLSTEVMVWDHLDVGCYFAVSFRRSSDVASLGLVLHCIQLKSFLCTYLGGLRWYTPSRLLFPQSVGAEILVFCLGGRGGYGLFADLVGWDDEFSFSFPGIVCRVGSVPTSCSFAALGFWFFRSI